MRTAVVLIADRGRGWGTISDRYRHEAESVEEQRRLAEQALQGWIAAEPLYQFRIIEVPVSQIATMEYLP